MDGNQSASPRIPNQLTPLFNPIVSLIQSGLAGNQTNQGFQGQFAAPFGDLGEQALQGFREFLGGPAFTDRLNVLGDLSRTGGVSGEALSSIRKELQPSQALERQAFTRQKRSSDAARGGLFSTGGAAGEGIGLATLLAAQEQNVLQTALAAGGTRLQAAGALGAAPAGLTQALGAEAQERGARDLEFSRRLTQFNRSDPIAFANLGLGALGGTPTTQPTFGPSGFETLATTAGALAPLFSGGGKGPAAASSGK